MPKYKNIEVKPIINASLQAALFSTQDVVFDWTEVPLPVNGPCRVISVSVINRDHAAAKAADVALELFFSKSNDFTLGTINSTASMVPNDDLIGVTSIVTGDYDAGLDFVSIASANPDALVGLILEPKSTERSIYVAGLTRTGNEPDLRSSFLVDGAHTDTSATLTVKGVDAREIIAPGDVLHAEDDAVIGKVESVDSATQITLQNSLITPQALADEDKIHILQPIKLMIGVEY
tara:strand:+ start:1779 stop:2480 length:702 start_codon:yes stop_codon:yes gene_type:complete